MSVVRTLVRIATQISGALGSEYPSGASSSVVIHNFWALAPGELQTAHELQNFVKNLAIMAGLLGYAGLGAGPWSLDARRGP